MFYIFSGEFKPQIRVDRAPSIICIAVYFYENLTETSGKKDIIMRMTLWLGAGSERSCIRSPGCLIKAGFTAASFRLKLRKTKQWPAGVCEGYVSFSACGAQP